MSVDRRNGFSATSGFTAGPAAAAAAAASGSRWPVMLHAVVQQMEDGTAISTESRAAASEEG